MKHLEAGLVVGGIFLIGALVASFAWWLLSLFIGAYAALGVLALVVLVAATAIVVDWKTEKKETPK
jgi:hypothetical protein